MLELLAEHDQWMAFLTYKLNHNLLDRSEEARLRAFIEQRRYVAIARGLADGSYEFGCPVRKELNKIGTDKKRVVYTFCEDESMILKLLSYLLYRYDDRLPPNCYAFRREIGARRAFTDFACPQVKSLWCFQADISNYFNSIDVSLLETILCDLMDDDPPLLRFLLSLLKDDRCIWQGTIITEQKGVMAGTPISPFLANLYLQEMDWYFYRKGVRYGRYSDDIILFDTKEQIQSHIQTFRAFIENYHLRSNPDKEQLCAPGEAWSFLGFEYCDGRIDISPVTVRKLMGKIRRSARSVRRWMLKNGAEPERALRAFNRKFNRKFFSDDLGRELCWTRWFFPLINHTDSLRMIDAYMQQYQRYLVTGTHNKSSYRKVPYELLRRCGYRPLVSAYYQRWERPQPPIE